MDKFLIKYYGIHCLKSCFTQLINPYFYDFIKLNEIDFIKSFLENNSNLITCSYFCVWYAYLITIHLILLPLVLIIFINCVYNFTTIFKFINDFILQVTYLYLVTIYVVSVFILTLQQL